jgi:hypothetical protein
MKRTRPPEVLVQAAQAGIDLANLYNAISGKRPASPEMLAKLQSALMKIDD